MDRINWVTSDSFHAIGQLARVRNHQGVDPGLVHARMQTFLEALVERSREAGFSEQDTKLALYAVTALADEVAMASAGSLRDHWSRRPLQLALFGENVAGERFFEHLESIRRVPARADVLRVYYLCLLFGFRGRYGVRGAEVPLTDLVDSVRVQLGRSFALPEALSPNGARPEQGLVGSVRRLPLLRSQLAVFVLGVVALVAALQVAFSVALDEQLRQLVACTQQTSTG
jgi:type VI secretion system protein ImpK